jgi:hypothetical protein
MVRGSNGSAGLNQQRDKSVYYKDYYERNKLKLKRQRVRRIADRKQQNEWMKSQGIKLLNDPEDIKQQNINDNKILREKIKNYRRIRYEATKEYYVNYYQKNKVKIKAKRDAKKNQSNLIGADA